MDSEEVGSLHQGQVNANYVMVMAGISLRIVLDAMDKELQWLPSLLKIVQNAMDLVNISPTYVPPAVVVDMPIE